MQILFEQAEKEFSKHPERSDRYVKLTRNISTKYNIPLPNLRVRLSNNTISRKCLECGDLKKVPYTKKN